MKNTMRYFSLAVLFVAVAALTSCEKEETASNGVSGTYTASVKMADNGSKALTEGGVKTFAVDDQIAVIYVNTSGTTVKAVSEPLTAGDIAAGNKRANFKVTLTNPNNTKPITYIYPAAMANDDGTVDYSQLDIQDGTIGSLAALDACKYTADSWGGEDLPADVSLINQLAICKFTINDFTSSVTRLTIKNGSDIYTVNTSSLSTIWVAMKPVTTGDITVYAAKGKELYKKTVSSPTLDAGRLYPVNVTTTKVDGAISGLFSVSSTKQVYFSQGNLQATTTDSWSTWTFSFMEHQYSMVETDANPYCTANYGNKTVVSLFGWGTSGYNHRANYWKPNSTNNQDSRYYNAYNDEYYDLNQSTGKADWGYNAISNGGNTENSGWRTMTSDEWSYLLTNHTKGWASVNGVNGLVIRPDGVTAAIAASYDAEAWAVEEAAGAVFLPAAGVRIGAADVENKSSVSYVGSKVFYWTSTHYNNGGLLNAYRTYIDQNSTEITNEGNPACGNAVRLVGE